MLSTANSQSILKASECILQIKELFESIQDISYQKLKQNENDHLNKITNLHNNLYQVLGHVSTETYNSVRDLYRKELNSYWLQGAITNRVITKPLGYHGDYRTIEYMYENKAEGSSELGRLLHDFVTSDKACQSVRARKTYLSDKIKSICSENNNCTILSVASGPAAELRDVLSSNISPHKIVLLDQDQDALEYSIDKIKKINKSTEIIPIQASIIDVMKKGNGLLNDHQPFDYIYSAGLYDYLSDIIAKRLTKYLLTILSEDGEIEIGNFENYPIGFFSKISGDWELILRNEMDLLKLLPVNCTHRFFKIEDQIFVNLKRFK